MGASIYFSPEHESFRASVRDFLVHDVVPHADDWERDRHIARWLWTELGKRDLLGMAYPRAMGGTERDIFYTLAFLEELGRTGYGGLRASVAVHAFMATYYLARSGGNGLRERYLAPALRGDEVAALAVSEPGAGSDLSRISTTALRHGDSFVVDGSKTMVTNGTTADFYVTAVRTAAPSGAPGPGATGLSLLVIDSHLPGISTSRIETLGWRCADTADVRFDTVTVAGDRLIGRPGSGFYYLMRGFQFERLVAAAAALGGMDICLEETRQYLMGREAFGKKLADLQSVQHRLADVATELAAARQLVYYTAWRYEHGDLPVTECTMAKLHTTELACRIADLCLQLQGSHGFREGAAAARCYRDARAATMAAGPSEVMRDIIGHALFSVGLRGP